MNVFAKVIAATTALGGSSAAVVGVLGAFSAPEGLFVFSGDKFGRVSLYCPSQNNQFGKPDADANSQKIKCLYETDKHPTTEIRYQRSQDQEPVFKCNKKEGNLYVCSSDKDKHFTLEAVTENNANYLKVTVTD
ncbi:hypothetical protein MHLP_01855 [Candidatus Mycoplasma haematolamae str. Purdue]|uniref:Uncharacterized protein n=1 Tax=Mycoplasma haematolamae (strain Purdue) TaxID=1212765 RepID=I7CFH3_MYCHA|nr:hypothetical protein [Candidatus Mycoplasma haematolamae]AFO51951.1 hypothetical protein MHLP_01855 [Candidatus Mycoplasma haematolamae str. Purdue]